MSNRPRGPRRRIGRRRTASALLAALVVLAPFTAATPANAAPSHASYPFRNPKLPLHTRINDLLSRLTLTEKVEFLHQYQPAIPRLGIKLFKTGTEALHGIAWSNDYDNDGAVVTAHGTVFPQAIGLASTWDPALIRRVGTAVGQEARGFHAKNPRVWGLNLWAPVVNLLRDPRWGRNKEGYSSDPTLTGAIATAYGKGMEGGDPDHLLAAPTLKHYLAYNNETNRTTTSSMVPPRVLHDYYRKAFRIPLRAGAATGVMASYNLVNGRPATVDPSLSGVERRWSKRPLMNVTDAGAPNNLTGSQHYYATQAQADAAAIKAGINSFTVDGTDNGPTVSAVKKALSHGLLTTADLDRAVRQILNIRFRLGEFDPGGGRYGDIGPGVIDDAAHRKLARTSADESIVLLKNALLRKGHHALPLDADTSGKVAVVGPLSDTLYTDWYSGALPYAVTPLDGIRKRLGGKANVPTSEGVDRIALRDQATGKYVTAGTGSDGATLTERGSSAGDAQGMDVFHWGHEVVTLRTTANGKYVSLAGDHTLVNNAAQPNGWFVQQQFKLNEQPDGGYVLEYAGNDATQSWFGKDTYVTVDDDGTLHLGASSPDDAAHFTEDVLRSGVDQAVRAAEHADTAVVVVGNMPFINGREADDRTDLKLAARQRKLVEAVRKANPHTVVVLETGYPDSIDWAQRHVPGIVWMNHAGQETGNALADVLFGDVDPSGRLTQNWYRSDNE